MYDPKLTNQLYQGVLYFVDSHQEKKLERARLKEAILTYLNQHGFLYITNTQRKPGYVDVALFIDAMKRLLLREIDCRKERGDDDLRKEDDEIAAQVLFRLKSEGLSNEVLNLYHYPGYDKFDPASLPGPPIDRKAVKKQPTGHKGSASSRSKRASPSRTDSPKENAAKERSVSPRSARDDRARKRMKTHLNHNTTNGHEVSSITIQNSELDLHPNKPSDHHVKLQEQIRQAQHSAVDGLLSMIGLKPSQSCPAFKNSSLGSLFQPCFGATWSATIVQLQKAECLTVRDMLLALLGSTIYRLVLSAECEWQEDAIKLINIQGLADHQMIFLDMIDLHPDIRNKARAKAHKIVLQALLSEITAQAEASQEPILENQVRQMTRVFIDALPTAIAPIIQVAGVINGSPIPPNWLESFESQFRRILMLGMEWKLTVDLAMARTHKISFFWPLPGEAFDESRHAAATGDASRYIAFTTLAGIHAESLDENTASKIVVKAQIVGCDSQDSVA